jgi:uncharacterized protein (DUF1330 family)
MSVLVVGVLHDLRLGPEIAEYLRRVDATLAPYGGQFLVHGAEPEMLEGHWTGDLVVLTFPHRRAAQEWYASAAYQEILPLRQRNATTTVMIVPTVGADHSSAGLIPDLMPAPADR